MHQLNRHSRRISARPAAMLAALALAAAPLLHSGTAKAQTAAASANGLSMEAPVASMSGGRTATAYWTTQPPTPSAARMAAMQAAFARSHRSGPTDLPLAAMDTGGQSGPGPEQRFVNEAKAGDFVLVDRVVKTGNG